MEIKINNNEKPTQDDYFKAQFIVVMYENNMTPKEVKEKLNDLLYKRYEEV